VSIQEEDENLNEGLAMDLFNEGHTSQAVEMYKKLIERYPEKADYYRGQLEIISDDVNDDFSTEETPLSDYIESSGSLVDTKPFNEEPSKPTAEDKSTDLPEEKIQEQTADSEVDVPSFFEQIDIVDREKPETTQSFVPNEIVHQEDEPQSKIEEEEIVEGTPPGYDSDVTESAAIFLFNQGRNEEAIAIYRALMKKQPERKDYFAAQISILQNEPFVAEDTTTTNQDNADEEELTDDDVDFVNESTALMLFNQGKIDAAIEVFEKLKVRYPEKAAHFASQIAILKS
jgi:tetratricopeptide (TPR) repeat protein